jgi:hypothetical protein
LTTLSHRREASLIASNIYKALFILFIFPTSKIKISPLTLQRI